jgi:hypothetical protein
VLWSDIVTEPHFHRGDWAATMAGASRRACLAQIDATKRGPAGAPCRQYSARLLRACLPAAICAAPYEPAAAPCRCRCFGQSCGSSALARGRWCSATRCLSWQCPVSAVQRVSRPALSSALPRREGASLSCRALRCAVGALMLVACRCHRYADWDLCCAMSRRKLRTTAPGSQLCVLLKCLPS